MRLWSLHPRFLDAKGLVAVWREGLLAKAVLRGATRGYRSHPQLERFRAQPRPLASINAYLRSIWIEARSRGYRFDATQVGRASEGRLPVSRGQLAFEWEHLLAKLCQRAPSRFATLKGERPAPHPHFRLVRGGVATWERPSGLKSKWTGSRPPRALPSRVEADGR